MDLHFSDLKQRHIRINGRQVNFNNKSSHQQRLVHPLQSNAKPNSVKFNNSNQIVTFSNKKYLPHFHLQSPSKDIKLCIKPQSSRTQRRVLINNVEISSQKKKPCFLWLQQTRPQSVNENQARKTGFTDIQLGKQFCISSKKDNKEKKIKNSQALAPSLKPRTLSMNSQKKKNKDFDVENCFKVYSKIDQTLNEETKQSSGIEKCLKLLNKGQVLSFEQVDPPMEVQNRVSASNDYDNQVPVCLHNQINEIQKIMSKRQNSYVLSKDEVDQSSIKIIYHNIQKQTIAQNKTSFDNEVPPSQGSNHKQEIQANNEISKPRIFGHRKIQSLFTQHQLKKSYHHQRNNSFDFDRSIVDQLGLQMRPQKKQTLHSKHFSDFQKFSQNQFHCQKLQTEFNKGHQRTNSSISLQELNALYHQERQILFKYLQSMNNQQIDDENSSVSLENKSRANNEEFENQEGIPFLEFINELYQLQQEKNQAYPSWNQNILIPNNFQYPYEQWSIHQLIKIGQNQQQIHENKMIIHVLSIWLKQMGYQKQQTKFQVVNNIKRLLLNVLNLTEQQENNFISDQRSDSVYQRQEQFDGNRLNCTFIEEKQKNNQDNLRRYSFNHQDKEFRPYNNAFVMQRNFDSFKQSENYNCGLNNRLKRSLHTYLFRSKSPSNFYHQQNSMCQNFKQASLENIISEIYQNLYHKLIPAELQLQVLFHLCKRGWKFFQLLTVKILRQILLNTEKNKDKKEKISFVNDGIDEKIEKIIQKMISQ